MTRRRRPKHDSRLVGISIDFDYFVPEKGLWDMQHCESLFYLDALWMMRGALIDEMKTSGEEVGFWDWLQSWTAYRTQVKRLYVSDSHSCAIRCPELMLSEVIILFDRHHDCWPAEKDNRTRQGKMIQVHCHTWGRAWLEADRDRQLIWVYPDHEPVEEYTDDIDEMTQGVRDQLHLLPRKAFNPHAYSRDLVHALHICRSGCWVPPWLDQNFYDFLNQSGMLKKVMQDKEWDPTRIRWTTAQLNEARRIHEETRAMMERHREHQSA